MHTLRTRASADRSVTMCRRTANCNVCCRTRGVDDDGSKNRLGRVWQSARKHGVNIVCNINARSCCQIKCASHGLREIPRLDSQTPPTLCCYQFISEIRSTSHTSPNSRRVLLRMSWLVSVFKLTHPFHTSALLACAMSNIQHAAV